MALPTVTFTIPSLHDRTELECRVYRPTTLSRRSSQAGNEARTLGAVIAHPYANLGGCFDDPAVLTATEELLALGYTVGTFNFRGAGNSKGSTSWTGLPELADYVSFVGFIVTFLHALNSGTNAGTITGNDTIPESNTSSPNEPNSAPPPALSLILSGYSYGSRILTHIPSVSAIVHRFTQPAAGSAEAAIIDVAQAVAAREKANEAADNEPPDNEPISPRRTASGEHSVHSVHMGGSEDADMPSPSRHSTGSLRGGFLHVRGHRQRSSTSSTSHESPALPPSSLTTDRSASIDLRFLLISPVLPPAGWLTSPRLSRPTPQRISGDGEGGDGENGATPPPVRVSIAGADMDISDCWWDYPSLVVYGDADQFTSAAKIRRWLADTRGSDAGAKEETSPAHLSRVELRGQGHFWHSREERGQLKEAVRRWVSEVPEGRRLM